MLAIVDRSEAIEGIQRGLASMERGEGRPASEFFEEIREHQGIPSRGMRTGRVIVQPVGAVELEHAYLKSAKQGGPSLGRLGLY